MADGLVRKIRFDVTQWNLERIHRLAETIARREAGIGEFLQMPERLRPEARELVRVANELNESAASLEEFNEDEREDFRARLRELRNRIESVQQTVRREQSQARELRAQLFEPLSDRPDVNDYLVRAAEEMGKQLKLENYWEQRTRCDSLFSEYVDLMRGIALRSARFGDDDLSIGELFLIADVLPSAWGRFEGWAWQSLAVPARVDQSRSTDAMVLRIGFPEWTVWALPLLHHEFGHIVVKRKRMEARGAGPAALADALAVLVAGPAYACATLLLRLDPAAVGDARPETALRSATIIKSLRAIAEDAALDAVQRIAKRLEDEWRVAVDDAGGSVAALDEALTSSPWRAALDKGRSVVHLATGERPQPHWAARWATVSNWAGHLKDGTTENIDLAEVDGNDGQGPSLNLVLNAAWLARVRPDPNHDADVVEVEAIGKRAVARMLEYIRASVRTETKVTGVR